MYYLHPYPLYFIYSCCYGRIFFVKNCYISVSKLCCVYTIYDNAINFGFWVIPIINSIPLPLIDLTQKVSFRLICRHFYAYDFYPEVLLKTKQKFVLFNIKIISFPKNNFNIAFIKHFSNIAFNDMEDIKRQTNYNSIH